MPTTATWTDPVDRSDGYVVGQTVWDQLLGDTGNQQYLYERPFADGPVELTFQAGNHASTSKQMNSNTTMYVGNVFCPAYVTVTSLQFYVQAVGAAGTIGIALFSSDGQTRLINVTSGSVSGTGKVSVAVSSVVLEPGMYYIAFNTDSTTDLTITTYPGPNSPFTAAADSGLKEAQGTVTVSAGTIPTTFNPDTDVTYAASACAVVRLN